MSHVSRCSHSGKWLTYMAFTGTTAEEPLVSHKIIISTSTATTDIRQQFDIRNAAVQFLTSGKYLPDQLIAAEEHALRDLDYMSMEHMPGVYAAKQQVLAYNPERHMFLCKAGWLDKVKMKPTAAKLRMPVHFALHAFDAGLPADLSMQECQDAIMNRDDNILLCTPGGYGKSVVAEKVIRPALLQRYGPKAVWICASTGAAASAMGPAASTIHSQAGVGRGKGLIQALVDNMKPQPKQRWKQVEVILIEECSLLSGAFMEMLDGMAKKLKDCTDPYGGIRLVLVGDMGQLAPVPDLQPLETVGGRSRRTPAAYMFESPCFAAANFVHLRLSYCWRYDKDGTLGQLLQRIRMLQAIDAPLSKDLFDLVSNSSVDIDDTAVLCCTKAKARAWSMSKLKIMPGPEMVYHAADRRGATFAATR